MGNADAGAVHSGLAMPMDTSNQNIDPALLHCNNQQDHGSLDIVNPETYAGALDSMHSPTLLAQAEARFAALDVMRSDSCASIANSNPHIRALGLRAESSYPSPPDTGKLVYDAEMFDLDVNSLLGNNNMQNANTGFVIREEVDDENSAINHNPNNPYTHDSYSPNLATNSTVTERNQSNPTAMIPTANVNANAHQPSHSVANSTMTEALSRDDFTGSGAINGNQMVTASPSSQGFAPTYGFVQYQDFGAYGGVAPYQGVALDQAFALDQGAAPTQGFTSYQGVAPDQPVALYHGAVPNQAFTSNQDNNILYHDTVPNQAFTSNQDNNILYHGAVPNQDFTSDEGVVSYQGVVPSQSFTSNQDVPPYQDAVPDQGFTSNQGVDSHQGLIPDHTVALYHGATPNQGFTPYHQGAVSDQGFSSNQGVASYQGHTPDQAFTLDQGAVQNQGFPSNQSVASYQDPNMDQAVALYHGAAASDQGFFPSHQDDTPYHHGAVSNQGLTSDQGFTSNQGPTSFQGDTPNPAVAPCYHDLTPEDQTLTLYQGDAFPNQGAAPNQDFTPYHGTVPNQSFTSNQDVNTYHGTVPNQGFPSSNQQDMTLYHHSAVPNLSNQDIAALYQNAVPNQDFTLSLYTSPQPFTPHQHQQYIDPFAYNPYQTKPHNNIGNMTNYTRPANDNPMTDRDSGYFSPGHSYVDPANLPMEHGECAGTGGW